MKNKLRCMAKEKRKKLNSSELSLKIKNNLFSLPQYKNAKNILCYYSIHDEVCTRDYFEDKTKNWYLPKVHGDELVICRYDNNLCLGPYNILEPKDGQIDDISVIDLILIPALCADKNGYRIGYGKGFYDRFIKKINKDIPKVILIYSELVLDSVYPDIWDEKCNYIVTENKIYEILC